MYIKRAIEDQVTYLSEHFPAVVITGARQTGKTTLIKKLTEAREDVTYVTLDYPRIRELARNDPELFLQQFPAPLIIDEAQYAPELLPFIKIRIDWFELISVDVNIFFQIILCKQGMNEFKTFFVS